MRYFLIGLFFISGLLSFVGTGVATQYRDPFKAIAIIDCHALSQQYMTSIAAWRYHGFIADTEKYPPKMIEQRSVSPQHGSLLFAKDTQWLTVAILADLPLSIAKLSWQIVQISQHGITWAILLPESCGSQTLIYQMALL